MQTVLGIFVGLLVLMSLIVAHEFGHFIMARKNGVRVKEFGIGFPPRAFAWLIKKDKNGKRKWKKFPKSEWDKEQDSLIFSLNALPIGGFCAMDGESDDDNRPNTFGSASYWKKTKILFGGVLMNWLVAFVILTVLCWTGLPAILDNQFTIKSDEKVIIVDPVTVAEVLENSPAEKSGFEPDDILVYAYEQAHKNDIVMIPNTDNVDMSDTKTGSATRILSSSDVTNFNESHANQTIIYILKRKKTSQSTCIKEPCSPITAPVYKAVEVSLNPSDSDYLLGITMNYGSSETKYTWSAPVVAAGLTAQITGETFQGLGKLVVNLLTGAARQVSTNSATRQEGRAQMSEASEGVTGIVGIVGGYFPSLISSGPSIIFLFMAVISISLACMNVLPIPALDGGRWLMITLARLQHKKLSKETEQKIVSRALIFLLILMAIITIMDIVRLF